MCEGVCEHVRESVWLTVKEHRCASMGVRLCVYIIDLERERERGGRGRMKERTGHWNREKFFQCPPANLKVKIFTLNFGLSTFFCFLFPRSQLNETEMKKNKPLIFFFLQRLLLLMIWLRTKDSPHFILKKPFLALFYLGSWFNPRYNAAN